MKSYTNDYCTVKEYSQERYMLEIICEPDKLGELKQYKNWEQAYVDAKEEIIKGNKCRIWDLKYEFIR